MSDYGLWLGSAPITPEQIGKVTANARGVRVGRHHWKDGFQAFYKTHTNRQGYFRRKGKARTPIERLNMPIEWKSRQVILQRWPGIVRRHFNTQMNNQVRRFLARKKKS